MPEFIMVLAVNAGVILALFVLAWAICWLVMPPWAS